MKKTLLCSALLAALMSVSGGAQAALVSHGSTGLVYDNVNHLLWYTDGTNRSFADATSWAAGLTTDGFWASSWTLSSFSQFGLLAAAAGYVAGDFSTQQTAVTTLSNLGINGTNNGFWSTDTMNEWPDGQGVVNSGSYYDGTYQQFFYQISTSSFSIRDPGFEPPKGSLAVASYTSSAPSAVPIPAAAWLMASGLGALGVAARKRRAKAA
jgi:hypothetical protein